MCLTHVSVYLAVFKMNGRMTLGLLGVVSLSSLLVYIYYEDLKALGEYLVASDEEKEELENLMALDKTIEFVEDNIKELEKIARTESDRYRFGNSNEYEVRYLKEREKDSIALCIFACM